MIDIGRIHFSTVLGQNGMQLSRAHVSTILAPPAGTTVSRVHVSVVFSEIPPTPITEPINAFILPA